MFSAFIIIKNGWRVYFSYKVKFAGLGLALCYMTVLGFDDITNGNCNYLYLCIGSYVEIIMF